MWKIKNNKHHKNEWIVLKMMALTELINIEKDDKFKYSAKILKDEEMDEYKLD